MTREITDWLADKIAGLTPEQRAFVMDDGKTAHYIGGPAFGKTHAGIVRCFRLAIEHPGIIILACDATTHDGARRMMEFAAYMLPQEFLAGASQTKGEICLANGSVLLFRELAYGRRLHDYTRGLVIDAIYVDNNEYISYRDFLTLFARAHRRTAPALHAFIFYTGEVEWRHWRDVDSGATTFMLRLAPGHFEETAAPEYVDEG